MFCRKHSALLMFCSALVLNQSAFASSCESTVYGGSSGSNTLPPSSPTSSMASCSSACAADCNPDRLSTIVFDENFICPKEEMPGGSGLDYNCECPLCIMRNVKAKEKAKEKDDYEITKWKEKILCFDFSIIDADKNPIPQGSSILKLTDGEGSLSLAIQIYGKDPQKSNPDDEKYKKYAFAFMCYLLCPNPGFNMDIALDWSQNIYNWRMAKKLYDATKADKNKILLLGHCVSKVLEKKINSSGESEELPRLIMLENCTCIRREVFDTAQTENKLNSGELYIVYRKFFDISLKNYNDVVKKMEDPKYNITDDDLFVLRTMLSSASEICSLFPWYANDLIKQKETEPKQEYGIENNSKVSKRSQKRMKSAQNNESAKKELLNMKAVYEAIMNLEGIAYFFFSGVERYFKKQKNTDTKIELELKFFLNHSENIIDMINQFKSSYPETKKTHHINRLSGCAQRINDSYGISHDDKKKDPTLVNPRINYYLSRKKELLKEINTARTKLEWLFFKIIINLNQESLDTDAIVSVVKREIDSNPLLEAQTVCQDLSLLIKKHMPTTMQFAEFLFKIVYEDKKYINRSMKECLKELMDRSSIKSLGARTTTKNKSIQKFFKNKYYEYCLQDPFSTEEEKNIAKKHYEEEREKNLSIAAEWARKQEEMLKAKKLEEMFTAKKLDKSCKTKKEPNKKGPKDKELAKKIEREAHAEQRMQYHLQAAAAEAEWEAGRLERHQLAEAKRIAAKQAEVNIEENEEQQPAQERQVAPPEEIYVNISLDTKDREQADENMADYARSIIGAVRYNAAGEVEGLSPEDLKNFDGSHALSHAMRNLLKDILEGKNESVTQQHLDTLKNYAKSIDAQFRNGKGSHNTFSLPAFKIAFRFNIDGHEFEFPSLKAFNAPVNLTHGRDQANQLKNLKPLAHAIYEFEKRLLLAHIAAELGGD